MLNAIRTDLRLLLECLKYQMKCPASQKQALLTIVSICQQDGQNVEFLQEIGGVSFIYNLARASLHPEVKETALFTLSSLAEFNENCKQALCREEIFCGLGECMKQEVSLTQKRVAVYMLSVLVSNNKQGQNLAKASGCIDILLNLFSESFPVAGGPNEVLQLWTSVSSALCGCVNNPQNEENQRACMCAFSLVKMWLMEVSVSRVELAQPICSFVGMTVANNPCAQEYFASVGGLVTLSRTFTRVVSLCKDSPVACKIAPMMTKTISACVADNEAITPVLSELSLVPDLLILLSSSNLSSRDQLAVVLTLGHCTDACVEHQSQLLMAGGLPLMISLLTEARDEEVRKAATFVLQTCRKIMESDQIGEGDLQRHRRSAQEILQRIQQLESRQPMGEDPLVQDVKNFPALSKLEECREEFWEGLAVQEVKSQSGVYEQDDQKHVLEQKVIPKRPPVQRTQHQKSVQHVRRQIVRDFDKAVDLSQEGNTHLLQPVVGSAATEKQVGATKKTHRNQATHSNPPEAARDMHSPDIFKHPAPVKREQHRVRLADAPVFNLCPDEMSLCSELLDSEIERIVISPVASKPRKPRCAGCVSGVDEVNSRSFGAVLHHCKSLCQFHLLLQRAEDGLRKRLQSERETQTHHRSDRSMESKEREGKTNRPDRWESMKCKRKSFYGSKMISLTPLKRPCEGSNYRDGSDLAKTGFDDGKQNSSCRQRERKAYSSDELSFLIEGVRRFGHSWNSILWAYPFQDGRTNVDLAKKYRQDLH